MHVCAFKVVWYCFGKKSSVTRSGPVLEPKQAGRADYAFGGANRVSTGLHLVENTGLDLPSGVELLFGKISHP